MNNANIGDPSERDRIKAITDDENKLERVRSRIVEVLAKYNRTLEQAPLDALTSAMARMIYGR